VLGVLAGSVNALVHARPHIEPGLNDPVARLCRHNLQQLGIALTQYAGDNGGRYPRALRDLHPFYIGDESLFRCPGGREGPADYLFQGSELVAPSPDVIVACDASPYNHHGRGGYALRASGNVEWLNSRNLQAYLLGLRLR